MPHLGDFGWHVTLETDPRVYRRLWVGPLLNATQIPDSIQRAAATHHGQILDDATGQAIESDSVHELYTTCWLDRVPDLVAAMHELYRICANGALVHVAGAYWNHVDARADPTRVRGFAERTMAYFGAENRGTLLTDPFEDEVGVRACAGIDFKIRQISYTLEPGWEGRSEEARRFWLGHGANVCKRISFVLVAVKPCRPEPVALLPAGPGSAFQPEVPHG